LQSQLLSASVHDLVDTPLTVDRAHVPELRGRFIRLLANFGAAVLFLSNALSAKRFSHSCGQSHRADGKIKENTMPSM